MKDVKVIVSLTSHSVRIKNLSKVLFQIYNGTFKDLQIVLTLYKDDVKLITPDLQAMIDNDIVKLIVADKDLGPHLKYFYAMQEYRSLPVITIDDDVMYKSTFVEELYNSYKKYGCIIAQRCFDILSRNGEVITHYMSWIYRATQKDYPTERIFATGHGGILYPPDCLKLSNDNIPEILDCKFDDDFYLKALEVRNHLKIYATKHTLWYMFEELNDNETQSIGLWGKNQVESDNNVKKFIKEFTEAIRRE